MEKTTRITNNGMLSAKFAHLRRQAEERIKQWPNLSSQTQADLHKVVHELKIHLAEQEIQNEELKREIKAVIEQQDKDAKMYDFGPFPQSQTCYTIANERKCNSKLQKPFFRTLSQRISYVTCCIFKQINLNFFSP